MSDQVYLKIDGEIHSGWTDVSIQYAINALCTGFSLGIKSNRQINCGMATVLMIDQEQILTGYIDSKSGNFDDTSSSLSISGRDKTADLIDCSAMNSPASWKGAKLEKIASDLCAPFGIKVYAHTDTGAAFANFALEQGESPFDAITRMTKLRGLLISSTNKGDMIIFSPSPNAVPWALEEGKNVVSASSDDDAKDRFSEYHLKGQQGYSKTNSAKDAASPKSIGYDKGVIRYRPKLIIADEQSSISGLKNRADFEATIHAANAQTVSITTNHWRDPDGKLWELGTLIPIRLPTLDIDMAMVLSEVNLRLDETGRAADLKFVRKESYTKETLPEAKPEKAKKNTTKAKQIKSNSRLKK